MLYAYLHIYSTHIILAYLYTYMNYAYLHTYALRIYVYICTFIYNLDLYAGRL
jgi:hypothetical protein